MEKNNDYVNQRKCRRKDLFLVGKPLRSRSIDHFLLEEYLWIQHSISKVRRYILKRLNE